MQNMSNGKTSFLNLDSNLAALLCYVLTPCCLIGTILSLIFYFTEKDNRFVRFHAMQELLLLGVNIAIGIVIGIFSGMLSLSGMSSLGFAVLGLRGLIGLIFLGIFIYVGIQAYQNNWTKLPVIGDLAEKWSS